MPRVWHLGVFGNAVEITGNVPSVATLAEIAKTAGVGIGTVSRVLSGSPSVSDAMRARVLAVAGELGYEQPRKRRAATADRLSLVGVLVAYFDAPSVLLRFSGMVPQLQAHDLHLVLYNVVSPAQARTALMELPRSSSLSALVVVSLPLRPDEAAALAAAPFPVVLLDTFAPGLQSVSIDDREGGRLATRHLIDLGHRRIGHIGEPSDNPFGFTSSAHREEGYRAALRQAGITVDETLIRHGAHLRGSAKQMALDLLASDVRPTAIVAASDMQALGVLEAAAQLGLRVPDDLSVIGYDDIEIASVMGLTTVRQPLERSGARAADLVVESLNSNDKNALLTFDERMDVELVVRTTTRPPR